MTTLVLIFNLSLSSRYLTWARTCGNVLKSNQGQTSVVFRIIFWMALRRYGNHSLRWSPVLWFPKWYSWTSEVFMRNIMESVLDDCKNQGLYIPAVCFDGQWHIIVTRTIINNLLTLRQLQKDTWKEAEKKQKSEIIKEFARLRTEFQFQYLKMALCTPLRVRERLWCRDEIINQWNKYQSCSRRSFKL